MLLFMFFFKQKTAYEMRISDWSSDVCSSDLPQGRVILPSSSRIRKVFASAADQLARGSRNPANETRPGQRLSHCDGSLPGRRSSSSSSWSRKIGRESCRERVCQYV